LKKEKKIIEKMIYQQKSSEYTVTSFSIVKICLAIFPSKAEVYSTLTKERESKQART